MKFSATLRLQFIIILWGFTGVFGKLISISAIPLVWFRILISFIVIFFMLKFSKISLKISSKQLFLLMGFGAIIGVHWIFFFGAIKVSNVAIALSTLSVGALFSAVLEPLFFKRKILLSEIILAVVVSFCILLIYNAEPDYWLGIVMGIICSFLSALFSVINAKIHNWMSAKKIIFYEFIGGWLTVSFFVIAMGEYDQILNVSQIDFFYLFILGALLTAYPMIQSVDLMKYISPFTLLLNINLEPVYGIIFAYFIFDESEHMSPTFYIATLIMISALIVNGFLKKKFKRV